MSTSKSWSPIHVLYQGRLLLAIGPSRQSAVQSAIRIQIAAARPEEPLKNPSQRNPTPIKARLAVIKSAIVLARIMGGPWTVCARKLSFKNIIAQNRFYCDPCPRGRPLASHSNLHGPALRGMSTNPVFSKCRSITLRLDPGQTLRLRSKLLSGSGRNPSVQPWHTPGEVFHQKVQSRRSGLDPRPPPNIEPCSAPCPHITPVSNLSKEPLSKIPRWQPLKVTPHGPLHAAAPSADGLSPPMPPAALHMEHPGRKKILQSSRQMEILICDGQIRRESACSSKAKLLEQKASSPKH